MPTHPAIWPNRRRPGTGSRPFRVLPTWRFPSFLKVSGMVGGDYRSAPSRHNADRPSPVLDAIRARGVLRVGTTGDYLPFSFLRPDGTYEGADIDMAFALADLLAVRPEFVPPIWPQLLDDF